MRNIFKTIGTGRARHLLTVVVISLLVGAVTLFYRGSMASATVHEPFIAFSLREAEIRARSGRSNTELLSLGGITRIAGLVYDRHNKDLILVGLAQSSMPPLTLDDLAVALRARLVHNEWPLVSIDPVADTERTRFQSVRFDGHLADTAFGRVLLDCDILLKRYSLQQLAPIDGVRQYNLLVEDSIRADAERAGVALTGALWRAGKEGQSASMAEVGRDFVALDSYQARFWFYARQPYTPLNQDVFCIKELRLAVKSERNANGSPMSSHDPSEQYAHQWTEHFEELCLAHPVLKRLKGLYDLVSVAEAFREIGDGPPLTFLLHDYRVVQQKTATTYKLEELYGIFDRADRTRQLIRLSGGIELRTQIKLMNYGDETPLRSIVIDSRPSPDTLCWHPPLAGWRMPNAEQPVAAEAEDVPSGSTSSSEGSTSNRGCSVLCQAVLLDPVGQSGGRRVFSGFPPPPSPLPPLKGVSMRMDIDARSFQKDSAGAIAHLRDNALESRPSPDSPVWMLPVPKESQHDPRPK